MVNTSEFGLPLQKILELGNLVKQALKDKDDKILALTSDNVDVKAQLASALANDEADHETITTAQNDLSSARDELAALKTSVANNADNQQLLAAIAALEGDLGFSGGTTPASNTPNTPGTPPASNTPATPNAPNVPGTPAASNGPGSVILPGAPSTPPAA